MQIDGNIRHSNWTEHNFAQIQTNGATQIGLSGNIWRIFSAGIICQDIASEGGFFQYLVNVCDVCEGGGKLQIFVISHLAEWGNLNILYEEDLEAKCVDTMF